MIRFTIILAGFFLYSCSENAPALSVEVQSVTNALPSSEPIQVNDTIQPYVDSIAAGNEILDEAIGYSGIKPKAYFWFEKLMLFSTDEELMLLTDHYSPAVRGYAFWALVEREHYKVKEIMLNHIDDTMYVFKMSGCVGYDIRLNEFFLSVIAPHCLDRDCSRLPPEDIAEIKEKMNVKK